MSHKEAYFECPNASIILSRLCSFHSPSSKKASGATLDIFGRSAAGKLLKALSSQKHAGAGSAWHWLLLHFRQAMPSPTPFQMAAKQLQELQPSDAQAACSAAGREKKFALT